MLNILFADGFEEIEALTVVDLARRAGIEVNMISLNKTNEVIGGHNIKIYCDALLKEADLGEGVILPGGIPGVPNIEKNADAVEFKKKHYIENRLVAAICAAPTLLGRIGLLAEKKAVCYPDLMCELICQQKTEANVVVDENVITSKSAGTAIDFAYEIIKYLKDEKDAKKITEAIYYKK